MRLTHVVLALSVALFGGIPARAGGEPTDGESESQLIKSCLEATSLSLMEIDQMLGIPSTHCDSSSLLIHQKKITDLPTAAKGGVSAADRAAMSKAISLFRQLNPLAVSIKSNLPFPDAHEVERSKRLAVLQYASADGQAGLLEVEVSPRGKTRRWWMCGDFVPMMIHLPKKKDRRDHLGIFADADSELKLTTHCNGSVAGEAAQQRVEMENLLYRALNVVGVPSFRVRKVFVSYVDWTGREVGKGPGFLMEHADDLAKREGWKYLDPTHYRNMDTRDEAWRSLNLDIALVFLQNKDVGKDHNEKNFLKPDGSRVSVPYDFNLTPLVGRFEATVTGGDLSEFERLLKRYPRGDVKKALQSYLSSEKDLKQLLTYSKLNDENRARFAKRFDAFMAAARIFVAAQTQ